MSENKNYVVYHCHSDLSNLTAGTKADSTTSFIKYLDRAKELGMTAISISEHGNLAHHFKKKMEAEKRGLKYIHGMEAYITENVDRNGEMFRDNYHFGLYAKNFEGYKELNKLSSQSFLGRNRDKQPDDGHFYYNPRISMEELKNTSDNIIITTACLGSPLWKMYQKANMLVKSSAEDAIKELYKVKLQEMIDFLTENKHRVFLEIQYHEHPEQLEYNMFLFNLSHDTGIPLIAGTDTHSIDEDHAKTRLKLLQAKGASYGEEDSFDLTFKSYDEIVDMFDKQGLLPKSVYLEAIENTNVFASMIETYTLDNSPKYPRLTDNPIEKFKEAINEGWIKRGVHLQSEEQQKIAKERIAEEFKTYEKLDAVDYMLLQKSITDWCHEEDITTGYGRGSVTGSYIAYLLGVTEMDSIKHNLFFFRFLNPHRQTLADIDTDIDSRKRHLAIKHVSEIEGIYFSEIITFNTSKVKNSIKEMGRALNMPLDLVKDLANECDEFVQNLKNNDEAKFKQYEDNYLSLMTGLKDKFPELHFYASMLEGTVVSLGTHPSGYLVSPIPLDENVGTLYSKTSKYPISQINMKELEELNYLKLDLLGLDNMGIIHDACKYAGIEELVPDNIDVNDMEVWNSMQEDTLGVFQMESNSANAYLKTLFAPEILDKLKESNPDIEMMNLLSMANGAIRPSGASYRDNLSNGIANDNGHPALNDFLSDTAGYLIYQEQIMQFLVQFCNFTESESDTVRRGLAKKIGTEQYLPQIRDGFVGFMKEHWNETEEHSLEMLESFLKVIEDASSYGFSINHSQAYSYIGYACAWLKVHYPIHFITAILNMNSGKSKDLDNTPKIMDYARKLDIKVKSIRFGLSHGEYSFNLEENAIYKGIASIKFLNYKIVDQLNAIYNPDRKEKFFVDLCYKMATRTNIQSNQMDILLKLDYFKDYGRKEVLGVIYNEFAKGKDRFGKNLKEGTQAVRMRRLRMLEKYIKSNEKKIPKTAFSEQIKFELDMLGYAITVFPEVSYDYFYVMDINVRYTPVLILYRMADGVIMKAKVKKKTFYIDVEGEDGYIQNQESIYAEDIIEVLSVNSEFGWKHIGNGEFERNKNKIEDYLTEYKIVRPSILRKSV